MGKQVTAYKAFNPDMTCNGFKYEVGKTYEMDGEIELCARGFHACTIPFDVFSYYNMIGDDGKIAPLAKVTLEQTSSRKDGDSKIVGAKITIDASLTLPEFISENIKAVFDLYKSVLKRTEESKATDGDYSKLAASGDYSKLAASGHSSKLAASGNYSKLAASGYASQLAASGDYSQLAASGDYSQLAASGKDSVAASIGYNGVASAAEGGWIVLAYWDRDGKPKHVKSAKVGTEGIKPNVAYRLNSKGEFVEA